MRQFASRAESVFHKATPQGETRYRREYFEMSESYIEFSVSRRPNGEIHGQYSGCVWRNGQPSEWLTCPFGKLATDAWMEAQALAQQHGIPRIVIKNEELFNTLGFGPTRQLGGDHASA
ncbi:MAG: hypothetical protein NW223_00655 [Hyphomicrobiaceae bacterium]|nr:hypothetical protein [Hyphomicrobiaceae bacterium]